MIRTSTLFPWLTLLLTFVFLTTDSPRSDSAEMTWDVGVAKTVITPDHFMWMAGYGARNEPANGKLTDLWAKVLVLQDAQGTRGVIITLDLVGVARDVSVPLCKKLREVYGLSREQIAICTSHTHSGPVVGKNLAPLHYLGVDPAQQQRIDAYADELSEKIVATVGEALDDLQPSRLQWGNGHESFAVNRRNNPADEVSERREKGMLQGPVDHDVPVLTIRSLKGDLRALLFGYACHATTIGTQQWCGDYPGYAQLALEDRYPGCTALFWAGCGADQNPLPRREVALAEKYGDELADAVTDVLQGAMPEIEPTLQISFREIDAPLEEVPTQESLKQTMGSAEADSYQQRWAIYLLDRIERTGKLQDVYPYPISFWRLGDEIDFITLGGEVVVDYALRIKNEHNGRRTWIAGYSNDVMAYIPSLRVLGEGGYEGGGSNVYYGLPALWDEGIEETIIGAVDDMAKKLTAEKK